MRLKTFAQLLCGLTIFALCYIHLQIEIVELAYQGKDKQTEIRGLMEDKETLTYTILNMKSANHLGDRLLAEESNMEIMHPERIVRVDASKVALRKDVTQPVLPNRQRSLFQLISLR